MDIQVNKFRETLGLFKPVVPRKPRLEVLTNIMLKDGRAVATDMETMVAVPMPEDDLNCLIPYADVVRLLQYVPGDETLHVAAEEGAVTMSWSGGSARFETTKTTGDFPPVPEFKAGSEAKMDVDTLIPAMEEVIVYAATESARPVLTGVALVLGPEKTQIAAGDGFRMAHRILPLQFPRDATVIVPASSIQILKLLWQKTPRTLPAGVDSLIPIITAKKYAAIALDDEGKGLRIVFGQAATAFVRLIEGNPPDFLKLIPTAEPQLAASVMGVDLELAVRRLLNIARESSDIIRMEFKGDTATVSARGGGHNAASSIRVMTGKGDTGRVAVNSKYLLDYLRGKEGIVTITITEETSPVAFRYQKAPTVLIMPMQVQWGDEKPVEAAETGPETGEADETPENEAEEANEAALEDSAMESEEEAAQAEQEAGVEAPAAE